MEIEYFLADALGNVKQLADATGEVTLTQSYAPYGDTISSTGSGVSVYQFTGEMRDANGLTYLRARYLDSSTGRFINRDAWGGDHQIPMSYNAWLYGYGNPIRYYDPSGLISEDDSEDADSIVNYLAAVHNVRIMTDWGYYRNYFLAPSGVQSGSCQWSDGDWQSLEELEWVRQAVHDVTRVMGGTLKFKSAMRNKPIDIARTSLNSFAAMATPNYASWLISSDVILGDGVLRKEDNAKFIVAHELGHVWDFRWGNKFSRGIVTLMDTMFCTNGECEWSPFAMKYDEKTAEIVMIAPEPYPGTIKKCEVSDTTHEKNGCEIPYAATYGFMKLFEGPGWEDWAESFASYVYPNFFPDQEKPKWGLISGGLREKYIEEQIDAIP